MAQSPHHVASSHETPGSARQQDIRAAMGVSFPLAREGQAGTGLGERPAAKKREPQAWRERGEVSAGDRRKDEVP